MKTKEERERMKEVRRFWKTKPPKLVITMFDSAHFDWFRFRNQFEIKSTNVVYLRRQTFLTLKSWRNPIPLSGKRNPEKVIAIAKVTRLSKIRVNVCTVRNLTIGLQILKLQKL